VSASTSAWNKKTCAENKNKDRTPDASQTARLARWLGVFAIVVVSAGAFLLREAAFCLIDSSVLCQAIVTLCGQDQPFGLKTYSPDLLWAELALLAPGILTSAFALSKTAPDTHRFALVRAWDGRRD
jgi:hypothetical protein